MRNKVPRNFKIFSDKLVKYNIINNQKSKIMENQDPKVMGVKAPQVSEEQKITTEVYRDIFILVTRGDETQIAIRNSIIVREKFDSVQAAKDFIDEKPWKLIVNTILFIAEDVKKNK